MSFDLFPTEPTDPSEESGGRVAPLATRMRPRLLTDVVGQEHLTGEDKLLGRLEPGSLVPSLIFWGPPGTGKTTLARILATHAKAEWISLSAVVAGVKDVRQAVERARAARARNRHTLLFLDEIHRFNKAQQDALLPHVESGLLTLLGATTENPSFQVNAALLSRCRVVRLHRLDQEALTTLCRRGFDALESGKISHEPGVEEMLIGGADGDGRRLLNTLEIAWTLARNEGPETPVTCGQVEAALQQPHLAYDRSGEQHFNLISALQKSIRASDAQAAVYWLRRMLVSGEDPLYVARRLVRTASEDVGLADPEGLVQAVAAFQTVHFLGMPEAGAALLQCAVYLALAPKSNRIALAESDADALIHETGSLPVPLAFRNAVTSLMQDAGYGRGYVYDHDAPDGISGQDGLPETIRGARFYEPSMRGVEAELAEREKDLRARRERFPRSAPGADSPPSTTKRSKDVQDKEKPDPLEGGPG